MEEGLSLFNELDIEKLSRQIIDFIEKKVTGCNSVSDRKWFGCKEGTKDEVGKFVYDMFMEAEKKLELEEVVPYSEQEKAEALEKYKINAAQSKNFCEWRGYCMWTFSRKYSSEVLCTIIYQTCDGDYRRYISSIDEKCTKDGNVEGEKRAKEFALKKEVMRSFLKEDNIPLYCKILMEYGNMCNNVLANNMGDFFKSLQSIELSMEKKDVLGKEEYTEDYMIDKWESIIYYILVGEGVMPYAVLKQVEEDNIEKKNLKSENYTVEDIKRICHSYNMENQNQGKDIMLTEKFYKGIEICGKFDRRIQVGKRKADEERDGHFKVSFPSKLEEILKEICWRGGNVNNKNNENKKLYIYDTLNDSLSDSHQIV